LDFRFLPLICLRRGAACRALFRSIRSPHAPSNSYLAREFKFSVPLILRTRISPAARDIPMPPHQMHHRIQRQNHPHRNQSRRPPMRQQKHRRRIPIPHRQNPLPEISQPPPKQERQNKRPQRNLKHAFSQNKNLKRQRRRQNRRNKHAQKRIRIHPPPRPHSMFPRLRVKKYFPALLSQ